MIFDNESEVLHDRVKLSDIPKMTDNDYTVRGCTALIDAIGGAIHHIGNIHKYMPHYMRCVYKHSKQDASRQQGAGREVHRAAPFTIQGRMQKESERGLVGRDLRDADSGVHPARG